MWDGVAVHSVPCAVDLARRIPVTGMACGGGRWYGRTARGCPAEPRLACCVTPGLHFSSSLDLSCGPATRARVCRSWGLGPCQLGAQALSYVRQVLCTANTLLKQQHCLQAALPLVILRVTEYDVVWTVPTPLMHVTRLDPPASVYGYDVGGAAAASAGGDGSLHGEAAGRTAGTGGVRQVDRWDADEGDGHELEWWRIGCWTVQ